MLVKTLLCLAAVAALCLAEEEVARKERLGRKLQGRRNTASTPGWYIDSASQLSSGFPLASTICTNAGGTIINQATDNTVASPFVIPPACLPGPKTTQSECTQINSLWHNKFAYCCPLWVNRYDYTGSDSDGLFSALPQLDINNPNALGPFFWGGEGVLAGDETGGPSYLGLQATKWVGKGNKGGCKIFFDCSSNLDKASCKAQGGICLWQKNVCVEDPGFIETVQDWVGFE